MTTARLGIYRFSQLIEVPSEEFWDYHENLRHRVAEVSAEFYERHNYWAFSTEPTPCFNDPIGTIILSYKLVAKLVPTAYLASYRIVNALGLDLERTTLTATHCGWKNMEVES